jgi:hypothetical protein
MSESEFQELPDPRVQAADQASDIMNEEIDCGGSPASLQRRRYLFIDLRDPWSARHFPSLWDRRLILCDGPRPWAILTRGAAEEARQRGLTEALEHLLHSGSPRALLSRDGLAALGIQFLTPTLTTPETPVWELMEYALYTGRSHFFVVMREGPVGIVSPRRLLQVYEAEPERWEGVVQERASWEQPYNREVLPQVLASAPGAPSHLGGGLVSPSKKLCFYCPGSDPDPAHRLRPSKATKQNQQGDRVCPLHDPLILQGEQPCLGTV